MEKASTPIFRLKFVCTLVKQNRLYTNIDNTEKKVHFPYFVYTCLHSARQYHPNEPNDDKQITKKNTQQRFDC